MRQLWLWALVFCVVAAGAKAADRPTPEYVHINLYASVTTVQPGQAFDLYIEQLIEPGWHTYWKNPGDSGLALSARWDVPTGMVISDLRYPAPSRIAVPPLVNFGYNNRAIHAVTMTPPADLTDTSLNIAVDLDWLVCDDICLPEGGRYSLTLPVTTGTAIVNPKIADILQDVMLTHPVVASWPTTVEEGGGQTIVTFTPGETSARLINDGAEVEFYPEAWGVIRNAAEQVLVKTDNQTMMMTIERGERSLAEAGTFPALFVIKDGEGNRQAYQVAVNTVIGAPVTLDQPAVPAPSVLTAEMPVPVPAAMPEGPTILGVLALAIVGGLILNLMPCVFPVLSLKLLSLASLTGSEQAIMRRHGLMYALGVMATFVAIGGALVALSQAGTAVGWGFQLQNPLVVTLLIGLFTLLGLNLMGWFDIDVNAYIPARFQTVDAVHSAGSSFWTGVLATIVATPCTAPFMGAAMGFAFTQSPLVALTVFAALGLGLALPFVILTYVPLLQRALPRPGAWMITMREFLSFPMFLTAVWLVWVLAQQTGAAGVGVALLGVMAMVFLIWISRIRPQKTILRVLRVVMILLAFGGAIWAVKSALSLPRGVPVSMSTDHQPFSDQALRQALATDQPIFVNLTAAWCITCKVNERVALTTDATRQLFTQQRVIYLQGDWTNYDPMITQYLDSFERKGVPLYVVYGAPDATGARPAPLVLPQILTETIVQNAFKPQP